MNEKEIIVILVYAKIIILSLTSIGSILYALPLIFIRQFHTPRHLLSLNVGITLFICTTFWAIYYCMNTFYQNILWTENSCLVILYLQTMVICQFVYALCIVSLNRLCAVVYQRNALFRTKKWAAMCIAVQWIFAFLIPLPQFAASLQHCFESGLELSYQIYVLVIVGVVPTIFLAVTSGIIFRFVRRSTRRVQPTNNGHGAETSSLSPRDVSLLKHMIFMFVVYFCGWIPIYIIAAIDWDGTAIPYIALHALLLLPTISCVVDLIDLFLYNHELRTYFSNKLQNRPHQVTHTVS